MAFPLLPLIIGAVGLAACTAAVVQDKNNQKPLYSLAGSEWGFADGTDRYVQFGEDGELSGSGGCNNFFGSYELYGTRLDIGPIAATKKYCAPLMDAESKFLDALQNSRRIDATHKTLNLFDDAGKKILSLNRRDWD